jgi:hypothetical protein
MRRSASHSDNHGPDSKLGIIAEFREPQEAAETADTALTPLTGPCAETAPRRSDVLNV